MRWALDGCKGNTATTFYEGPWTGRHPGGSKTRIDPKIGPFLAKICKFFCKFFLGNSLRSRLSGGPSSASIFSRAQVGPAPRAGPGCSQGRARAGPVWDRGGPSVGPGWAQDGPAPTVLTCTCTSPIITNPRHEFCFIPTTRWDESQIFRSLRK